VVSKLWHAWGHGKQRRTTTRGEKAEEETAEAGAKPSGDYFRQQDHRAFLSFELLAFGSEELRMPP
jgi:hypothetical protein